MASKDSGAEPDKGKGKGGTKMLLIVLIVVVVLVGGGVVAFLMMGSKSEASPEPTPSPEPSPGIVLVLEKMTINLADGHYLKLGMSLQFKLAEAESEIEPDGSKAQDIAISLFSNREVSELTVATARDKLKEELVHAVSEAYEDEVYDVYFTEFVMQ